MASETNSSGVVLHMPYVPRKRRMKAVAWLRRFRKHYRIPDSDFEFLIMRSAIVFHRKMHGTWKIPSPKSTPAFFPPCEMDFFGASVSAFLLRRDMAKYSVPAKHRDRFRKHFEIIATYQVGVIDRRIYADTKESPE